jgi:hypothetical protein
LPAGADGEAKLAEMALVHVAQNGFPDLVSDECLLVCAESLSFRPFGDVFSGPVDLQR